MLKAVTGGKLGLLGQTLSQVVDAKEKSLKETKGAASGGQVNGTVEQPRC